MERCSWCLCNEKMIKYLGSVTVYSHLQACGMINDHAEECFRYQELMKDSQVVRKRKCICIVISKIFEINKTNKRTRG